jgi:lambda family phage tail tape measure protein
MPLTIEWELRNENASLEAIERMEQGLDASRQAIRDLNDEAMRSGFAVREFTSDIVSLEQRAAQQRDAMTKASFEKWIGHATEASEWTRRTFSSTIGVIGAGIAGELVDGAYDWQRALRGVLKQMLAVTAQMIIMRSLMTVMTGGTAGWTGFLHGGGGVLHGGGPIRAHSGTMLRDDEVPIVAQRGEFVLRKSAVDRLGEETVSRLNRGQAPAGAVNTFNVSVNVAGVVDAATIAREIGPEIVEYLRREDERGVKILSSR